ncbi:hypothetical protein ANANG_G00289980 [Anguilla anguilla]|uniref:Ig-like domain-containing protein n=1 Tax=Anguilla anguilla TaxID=7936 RepID=A0A9D3RJ87_ANGAN|nr:hypothetical protein ANANG_G00289980 [Anguilla anguilla]
MIFIRSAERDHSGIYTLSVKIENMEDKADIRILVVEKPGAPTAADGYTIQKAEELPKKTNEWFMVYEHNRRPHCTVSDLVMGNEYMFRVYSENICGLSESAGFSKNTAVIAKTGLVHKQAAFKEQDLSHSPKFTQPLVDRTVIAGYTAAISCSVRGFPKPKIVWLKNKMIIGDDPKYLMQNNQGVLTLNIRKPSLFDGGKYTCRAINDLGEDEVECKLEVRVHSADKKEEK